MANKAINLGFIGASRVNFGPEHVEKGAWNHALRIEKFNKKNLYKINVVGITDIDTKKAQNILTNKLKQYPLIYKTCKIYKNYENMINNQDIHVVIIGVPPFARGSLQNDMELKCLQKGIDIFVEKPLTSTTPELLLKYVDKLNKYQKYKNISSRINPLRYPLISVGYMFRYHPIIQKSIQIINNYKNKVENKFNKNIHLQYINATYNSSYPFITATSSWWNETKSGGPIVEQGTHFIDLIRYFCSNNNDMGKDIKADYDVDTLNVLAVVGNDKYNDLIIQTDCFDNTAIDVRNPILTQSQFRMNNGSIISFNHGINLHHKKYKTKIEIWFDGLYLCILNPYQKKSTLNVRESSLIKDKMCSEYSIHFDTSKDENDPYYIELVHFFNKTLGINPDNDEIYSDYVDAFKTYLLTYHIKRKSRKSLKSKL